MADRHHDVEPVSWFPPPTPYVNDVYYGTRKGNTFEMGKKIYISIHSHTIWVIILYIHFWHQGAAINMQGIETAFKCALSLHSLSRFAITCTLYYGAAVLTIPFTRLYACQFYSGSVIHSLSSSAISPPYSYSLYVVSEMLCTAMKQATASKRLTMSRSGSIEYVICFPCLSEYGFMLRAYPKPHIPTPTTVQCDVSL